VVPPGAPAPMTGQPRHGSQEQVRQAYPGDFTGIPDLTYAPEPDGQPDPGEIVWTWVPYEEDPARARIVPCWSWDATVGGCWP
jgi:hypothetical protein